MKKVLVMACAALVMAGCSSTPKMSEAERQELYRSHAGEEVSSFRMSGDLRGWMPLGDESLVVWTKTNEAWLLDLMGSCPDMDYAMAIALSSSANHVHKRFDSVTPVGSMLDQMPRMSCRIDHIRPLDTKAIKQAQDELRQANVTERPQAAGAEVSQAQEQ